jgi:hypothetical protein
MKKIAILSAVCIVLAASKTSAANGMDNYRNNR